MIFGGILLAQHVFAAPVQYVPLAPLPGIGEGGTAAPNLTQYLVLVFKLAIGLAAMLAVVMITIGGFEYMTSETFSGKGDGKKRIENAIYGLLLAIASWLILYTINPKLTEFNFSVDVPASQSNNGPHLSISLPNRPDDRIPEYYYIVILFYGYDYQVNYGPFETQAACEERLAEGIESFNLGNYGNVDQFTCSYFHGSL